MGDEHAGRLDVVRGDDADRHDVVRLGDDHFAGERHDRIEVVGSQRILEVAVVVGLLAAEEGEVALNRLLEQVGLAVDLDDLLAFLDRRADAGGGQHAAEPAPPARMRSTSVPCGESSTSISPEIIFFCVSGLSPMCEAISLRTAPAEMSLPMPLPGEAVSLATIVRFFTPRLTIASIRRWWEPTPMKPPIRQTAPSGISAAAASADNAVFILASPVSPCARVRARRSVIQVRRKRNKERPPLIVAGPVPIAGKLGARSDTRDTRV